MTKPLELNTENIFPFIDGNDYSELMDLAWGLQKRLEVGTVPGGEFNGWVNLPSETDKKLINKITAHAKSIREYADTLIVIGVGGSYSGTRAALEFIGEQKNSPKIIFAGHNISSDYLSELIEVVKTTDCHINVISKSGTTLEPMVAFSIIKKELEKKYGGNSKDIKEHITVTTDPTTGALKELADKEGYKTFPIPANIGGRFSVLTACGLLPMAVAGIDISEVIKGASDCEEETKNSESKSPAHQYGILRTALYKHSLDDGDSSDSEKGRKIELLGLWNPSLNGMGKWWKQLSGESMGKNNLGIFPATADFSSDLHSIGQLVQEGEKNLFETFIRVDKTNHSLTVPDSITKDLGENFENFKGKTLEEINEKVTRATEFAHLEGTVPNMTITLKDLTPHTLGYLFYFFQLGVAISCLLIDVNPFDQPGVEKYKSHIKELLK